MLRATLRFALFVFVLTLVSKADGLPPGELAIRSTPTGTEAAAYSGVMYPRVERPCKPERQCGPSHCCGDQETCKILIEGYACETGLRILDVPQAIKTPPRAKLIPSISRGRLNGSTPIGFPPAPTQANLPQEEDTNAGTGGKVGIVVGAVCGGVVALMLGIWIFVRCFRWCRSRRHPPQTPGLDGDGNFATGSSAIPIGPAPSRDSRPLGEFQKIVSAAPHPAQDPPYYYHSQPHGVHEAPTVQPHQSNYPDMITGDYHPAHQPPHQPFSHGLLHDGRRLPSDPTQIQPQRQHQDGWHDVPLDAYRDEHTFPAPAHQTWYEMSSVPSSHPHSQPHNMQQSSALRPPTTWTVGANVPPPFNYPVAELQVVPVGPFQQQQHQEAHRSSSATTVVPSMHAHQPSGSGSGVAVFGSPVSPSAASFISTAKQNREIQWLHEEGAQLKNGEAGGESGGSGSADTGGVGELEGIPRVELDSTGHDIDLWDWPSS